MLATGMEAGAVPSKIVEIIDLESSKTVCSPMPNVSMGLYGDVGGLDHQDNPMVCGGKRQLYVK